MPARVTAGLFALVAVLPAGHDPVQQAVFAQGSAVQCPAYAALGANGQPAVPLARVRAARLAPLETPTELFVCRYRGTTGLQLTGSRQVGAGLVNAGTQLAWSPRCMGGPVNCTVFEGRGTPYLIALRYPSGMLWVTTAYDVNGCEVTSNGTFTSAVYVGAEADHAYATGVGRGGAGRDPGVGGPCLAWPFQRLGQERRLVPPGPTALTICKADGAPAAKAAVVQVSRDFSSLVRALDGVRTRPTGNMCDPHGEDVVAYQLRFDYREGPAVVVDISKNCDPRVTNYSLDADGSAQLWAMVDDLAQRPR